MLLSTILLSNAVIGQSEQNIENKNSVLIEVLGHGFFYSLNYERILWGNSKTHTSGQIGISYYGKESGVVPLWIPISLNQSIRIKGNSYAEVGIGKMFRNDGVLLQDGTFQNNYQFEEWIFRLGYKRYFKNNKWLFKIAYTPIFQDKADFISWGGIAFGYQF